VYRIFVEETEKNHSQDLLQRWQQNIMMNLTNISQSEVAGAGSVLCLTEDNGITSAK
jgi:hypothetical protein